MRIPEFDKPFEVHIDVFKKAIREVLVQKGHPIVSREGNFMEPN